MPGGGANWSGEWANKFQSLINVLQPSDKKGDPAERRTQQDYGGVFFFGFWGRSRVLGEPTDTYNIHYISYRARLDRRPVTTAAATRLFFPGWLFADRVQFMGRCLHGFEGRRMHATKGNSTCRLAIAPTVSARLHFSNSRPCPT